MQAGLRSGPRRPPPESGTTLLEVLVAMGIFATAIVSLAHVLALSTQTNTASRHATFTTILAGQKMEQLRALEWGYDAAGLPRTDLYTDTTADAAAGCPAGAGAGAGTGLSPSPPGTLAANVSGYVDYLDEHGCILGSGSAPVAGAVYVRRWSVDPLPAAPDDAIVLQVVVMRASDRGGRATRGPGDARLLTLKTRKR